MGTARRKRIHLYLSEKLRTQRRFGRSVSCLISFCVCTRYRGKIALFLYPYSSYTFMIYLPGARQASRGEPSAKFCQSPFSRIDRGDFSLPHEIVAGKKNLSFLKRTGEFPFLSCSAHLQVSCFWSGIVFSRRLWLSRNVVFPFKKSIIPSARGRDRFSCFALSANIGKEAAYQNSDPGIQLFG